MSQGDRTVVRIGRGSAWALLALVGLLVLVAVGLPLVVRGRVLARLVDHHSKNVCGSIRVQGGHVSAGVALALLLQRPFDIALDGVDVREPEGDPLFNARAIRVRMKVLRSPWRVVVDRASLEHGRWRLIDRPLGQELTVALRRIPSPGAVGVP